MIHNSILLTDSYKVSHWKQYPPATETVYSYFESRGGKFKETVFFGLQYFLKEYLNCGIIEEEVDEAQKFLEKHLGPGVFNRAGWDHIINDHNGAWPVSIRAVPDGSVVPVLTPLMTIENTCPKCYWVTNYLETLLVQVWYPTTVATLSREMKKVIADSLERTGTPALIGFKLHDFGFRGVSSVESAGLGGAAHLVNFMGTDTMAGLRVAQGYYDADMPGFSIPAAEHSTITSWGKDNEDKAFENMLDQYPTGLVAVVSDSYDIFNACKNLWGTKLKDKVLKRDGTLVIRPDSGDPATVVCDVMQILGDQFGTTTNEKGFKVLPPQVRVIQGDGIGYESTQWILKSMEKKKWSADNIAFGMGGRLLQQVNRDTQMFAFKCSSVTVAGQERDVFKQPITQDWKKSKSGRFNLPTEVFRDGVILKEYTFDEVRNNASKLRSEGAEKADCCASGAAV